MIALGGPHSKKTQYRERHRLERHSTVKLITAFCDRLLWLRGLAGNPGRAQSAPLQVAGLFAEIPPVGEAYAARDRQQNRDHYCQPGAHPLCVSATLHVLDMRMKYINGRQFENAPRCTLSNSRFSDWTEKNRASFAICSFELVTRPRRRKYSIRASPPNASAFARGFAALSDFCDRFAGAIPFSVRQRPP